MSLAPISPGSSWLAAYVRPAIQALFNALGFLYQPRSSQRGSLTNSEVFVIVPSPSEESDETALVAAPQRLMPYLREVASGVNGVTKRTFGSVEVCKPFVLDFMRSGPSQRVTLNGALISRSSHETRDQLEERLPLVVSHLNDLLLEDRQDLLNITELASQNTAIDLRGVISQEFQSWASIPSGFEPKFDPSHYVAEYAINTEDDSLEPHLRTTLRGTIYKIIKQPRSMDEQADEQTLANPIKFHFTGTYRPTVDAVEYSGAFSRNPSEVSLEVIC